MNDIAIPEKCCPHCSGKGKVADDAALGAEMRKLRVAAGISLRGMAKRLGLSAPYVGDLELGQRAWHTQRVAEFVAALSPDFKPAAPFTL